MYEIASICLDSFIGTELARLHNDSGLNLRIASTVNSISALYSLKDATVPDIAIIDCDNTGEQTVSAVKYLKELNDNIKIIVIGNSSNAANKSIFVNLLNENIYHFYEKSTFLAEYIRGLDILRNDIEDERLVESIKAEYKRAYDSIFVNNVLNDYHIIDDPTSTRHSAIKEKLLSFESCYVAVAGISLKAEYLTEKPLYTLWSKILYNSAVDFFSAKYDVIITMCSDYRSINIIVKAPNGNNVDFADNLYDACREFVKYINSSSMFEINLGLSNCCHDLEELHFFYTVAKCAYAHLPTYSNCKDRVLFWDRMRCPDEPDFSYIQKLKNNILTSLMSKDIDVITNIIESAIDSITDKHYRPTTLISIIESIADSCMIVFGEAVVQNFVSFITLLGTGGFVFNVNDVNEIKKIVIDLVIKLVETSNSDNAQKSSTLISKIKKSVENNYHKSSFTVEQIANDIFMNYSYICSAFKKETGSTINQYIKNYRMSHAVELIHAGSTDIPRIAEKVGFSDVSYFSKCFKQYFGVTPKIYIKQQM